MTSFVFFMFEGKSPLNRYDPKSEQYSLDLLKRVIPNFQSVLRHRSELGFVPVKGILAYAIFSKNSNIRLAGFFFSKITIFLK
jgi:hypothetical protein